MKSNLDYLWDLNTAKIKGYESQLLRIFSDNALEHLQFINGSVVIDLLYPVSNKKSSELAIIIALTSLKVVMGYTKNDLEEYFFQDIGCDMEGRSFILGPSNESTVTIIMDSQTRFVIEREVAMDLCNAIDHLHAYLE